MFCCYLLAVACGSSFVASRSVLMCVYVWWFALGVGGYLLFVVVCCVLCVACLLLVCCLLVVVFGLRVVCFLFVAS